MPGLPPSPQLADFQTQVAAIEQELGFAEQDVLAKCLLLGEEIGELFKTIRTRVGLKVDTPGGDVGDELTDVLVICAPSL